ncbi:MAG: hypothetical protein ACRDV3_01635 [Acidothermaceae bacterium]
MRYLVAAYNNDDVRSEMHVTTPDARDQLESERQWVKTFAFDNCSADAGAGDYICQFDMVTKVHADDPDTAMGEITVTVAPADRPGWYMAADAGCGGG